MVDKAHPVNDYTVMIVSDENISPHDLWTVRLNFRRTLDGDLPEKLSAALEDIALAILLHNQEATDGDNWTVTLTMIGAPDKTDILRRIADVADTEKLPPLLDEKDIVAEKLPEKDWLRHVHDTFPPIETDTFFIYGSHYAGEKPAGLIPLQIDAATAFGSGEHETTRGCLDQLCRLKKEGHVFTNGLDMGCGSGILAIALVKLWPDIKVTAIDIDPESVTVTKRHARMNGVEKNISAAAGDGYNAPLTDENAAYDVIVANILANPLIIMAPALMKVLGPGGQVVLSGLLARQEEDVAAAHRAQGLKPAHVEKIGDWRALAFYREKK
jgi:ribosomal protein L11 methyltransferase